MVNTKVCLFGINCSGKSTLLKELRKFLPHFNIIEGSDALCKIGNVDKQTLKTMKEADKDKLRKKFLEYLESINENVIVSGHYSFLREDGSFEIAAKEDIKFYDLVLFLDAELETIKQRVQDRDGITRDLDTLKQWNDFELNGLQTECIRHNIFFSAVDSCASDIGSFIECFQSHRARLDPKKIFENFMQTHISQLKQTIILTDCDGTLDNKDGVKEFYKIESVSRFKVPNAFQNHRFYSFYQFFRLTEKRLEIPQDTFSQAAKLAADSMQPHKELIELLDKSHASVVAITAGIRMLWDTVFKNLGVSFHVVANDRETVITQDCKTYFAREFTRLGYRVIALGDGLVDIGMLEYATYPILIESKKTNEIFTQLNEQTKQKLIICNPNISIKPLQELL